MKNGSAAGQFHCAGEANCDNTADVEIPRLDPDVTADRLGDALTRAGCCVIDELVDRTLMRDISDELDEHRANASIGASSFEGHHTRRIGSPLPRSATFRSIAMHPIVLTAGDYVLGHATSWRYSAAEFIEIGPDETPQRMHRDQWKYDMVDFPFEIELNGMWAVTDFTEANGATRVVPGSNIHGERAAGNRETFSIDDSVPAEMACGSLLLYTGSLYHGGGPNQTETWRSGLSLQHAVAWLTQSTNQFLECPPDMVREWPDELARFVGYAKAGNGLGYWGDSEDPLSAVHPNRTFDRGWATVRPD